MKMETETDDLVITRNGSNKTIKTKRKRNMEQNKLKSLKKMKTSCFHKKALDKMEDNGIKIHTKENINTNEDMLTSKNGEKEKEEEKEKKDEKPKNLDDYELNDLEYSEAVDLDKRSFIQVYWSILRREHTIFFTFFSWNDYNLWYIKYARLVFLLSTDLAMNAFFFSDESMHRLYVDYGKYNFIQQIPQILYSTIVSHVIEIILCFLTLTDKHIYEIKEL